MTIVLKNSIYTPLYKTASQWIREVIKAHGWNYELPYFSGCRKHQERLFVDFRAHMPVTYFHNGQVIWNDVFPKKPFVFSFVRHPLIWYRSFWSYNKHKLKWDLSDFHSSMEYALRFYCRADSFSEFIDRVIQYSQGLNIGFLTQIDKVFFSSCNLIGKVENLKEDFIQILEVIEEDFDLDIIDSVPVKNKSQTTDRLSHKQAEQVLDIEKTYTEKYHYGYIPDEIV